MKLLFGGEEQDLEIGTSSVPVGQGNVKPPGSSPQCLHRVPDLRSPKPQSQPSFPAHLICACLLSKSQTQGPLSPRLALAMTFLMRPLSTLPGACCRNPLPSPPVSQDPAPGCFDCLFFFYLFIFFLYLPVFAITFH